MPCYPRLCAGARTLHDHKFTLRIYAMICGPFCRTRLTPICLRSSPGLSQNVSTGWQWSRAQALPRAPQGPPVVLPLTRRGARAATAAIASRVLAAAASAAVACAARLLTFIGSRRLTCRAAHAARRRCRRRRHRHRCQLGVGVRVDGRRVARARQPQLSLRARHYCGRQRRRLAASVYFSRLMAVVPRRSSVNHVKARR